MDVAWGMVGEVKGITLLSRDLAASMGFGEPIPVAHLPPEAADDELLVGRLNEKLRATIQETLDRALRERRSVFKG